MKPGDKIASYNVEFMRYAAQLNWGDSVLCHRFYQGLPNCLQDPIANREQSKPNSFQAMYQLAITSDNRYWGTKSWTRLSPEYREGRSRQLSPKTRENDSVHCLLTKLRSVSPPIIYSSATDCTLLELSKTPQSIIFHHQITITIYSVCWPLRQIRQKQKTKW